MQFRRAAAFVSSPIHLFSRLIFNGVTLHALVLYACVRVSSRRRSEGILHSNMCYNDAVAYLTKAPYKCRLIGFVNSFKAGN